MDKAHSIIIISIISALVVIGAVVWVASKPNSQDSQVVASPTPLESVSPQDVEGVSDLLNTNSSDQVNAIEKDLLDTNLDSLDAELNDMLGEINQI